ncbi:HAMP domain-containing histidine kinase [Acidiferrimicrobium sp. IK]|uniref:sensor histidine kinase n=1 Tax=Acidiferrimicrobium sp. IK TaxID=2871700 RepID=UPI0021CB1A98|nr:HAMP domain-containing sensor histidine kinase [Acidiferrimicrobium sp. IK]MCU4184971.1 HAMP domain-containing histidine kinase [Acidiferrimicrobium sp. IK]
MTRARSWWPPAAVAAAGAAGTAIAASASGIAPHSALRLVEEAVAASAFTGGVAWLVLRGLRRAAIGAQLAVATLAPVVAVALAVWWASSNMFLMSHDVSVLIVVLVVSGTAGLVAALLLGRRVAGATRTIEAMARRIGDEAAGAPASPRDPRAMRAPGELGDLAAELHATAARLSAARVESEALERSRRELVAWVSHDLRTPLAGIRAMAEALEDGIVDDDTTVARYHRVMRQETERLTGLVDDLFELSRIQSGVLDLHVQPVALDELLTEATAGAAIAASNKGVELTGPARDRSPVVDVSTAEMSRVVRNLLDNAIRHTPQGGRVEVGVGGDAARPSLWVQDGCGGIPAAVAARMFEPAYRGDEARTPGDGRAGLGLAVAKGLVEAHGGTIQVTNHGPGCRFVVTLPPAGAPSPAATLR